MECRPNIRDIPTLELIILSESLKIGDTNMVNAILKKTVEGVKNGQTAKRNSGATPDTSTIVFETQKGSTGITKR